MEYDPLELVVNEVAATMDIPADTLGPETSLAAIGMDSLQALQLLVALEQATQIRLNEEDLKHFTTVESIVNLLTAQPKGAAA
jgi:acyl carrier protein